MHVLANEMDRGRGEGVLWLLLVLTITPFFRFAVKSIFCSKDHDLEPVLREIRFLRACRHPCIIDVHDSFITTNPRYISAHFSEHALLKRISRSLCCEKYACRSCFTFVVHLSNDCFFLFPSSCCCTQCVCPEWCKLSCTTASRAVLQA